MHAKSLITAALALTAATSLVILSTRSSQADPAPLPSAQDNLEARVKQLEAEVKALREELKALKSQKLQFLNDLPLLGDKFEGDSGSHPRVFKFESDGDFRIAPRLWQEHLKAVPQHIEVETKDGKTLLKIQKQGDKEARVYELPRDKAKLEKDFPGMKMFHGGEGTPFRMRMFGPHGDFKAFDSKELQQHMKELHEKLSKEFGPEFSDKMKKEMEALRKEMEKQRLEEEKARKSEPPAKREPTGSEPISI